MYKMSTPKQFIASLIDKKNKKFNGNLFYTFYYCKNEKKIS